MNSDGEAVDGGDVSDSGSVGNGAAVDGAAASSAITTLRKPAKSSNHRCAALPSLVPTPSGEWKPVTCPMLALKPSRILFAASRITGCRLSRGAISLYHQLLF